MRGALLFRDDSLPGPDDPWELLLSVLERGLIYVRLTVEVTLNDLSRTDLVLLLLFALNLAGRILTSIVLSRNLLKFNLYSLPPFCLASYCVAILKWQGTTHLTDD